MKVVYWAKPRKVSVLLGEAPKSVGFTGRSTNYFHCKKPQLKEGAHYSVRCQVCAVCSVRCRVCVVCNGVVVVGWRAVVGKERW